MKKDIKPLCCICKETIEKDVFDPCSLVLITNSDMEWPDQKEQTFFCHMGCFRRVVNDDNILYILEADFPANRELEEEA